MYKNVPYDFNFYLVSGVKRETGSEFAGFITPERAAEIIGAERVEKLNPNSITVIFTNNVTNQRNYIPLTGWIMAHRISHIFHFSRNEEARKVYLDLERYVFKGMMKDILNIMGLNEYSIPSIDMLNMKNYQWLMAKLFTMGSARRGKLTNTLDGGGELIAQYLLSGKITFNRLTKDDKHIVILASAFCGKARLIDNIVVAL